MKPNINRLVIGFLGDLSGIPQTAAEIAIYVGGRIRRPAEAVTDDALRTLETLGYVEKGAATADAEPLWKVTAAGLRQAKRMVPASELDPMIWGN